MLGPLLSCIVSDGLSAVCANSTIIKFADDVTIVHAVRDPVDDELETEWQNILAWSSHIGLPLNVDKCGVMDIISKRSLSLSPIPNLASKDFSKILGVIFSNDLTWNRHVEMVVKKANKRFFILRNLKRSGCPTKILIHVYRAMIQSLFIYCFPVFCNLPRYLLEKLNRVEKRAARIIGGDLVPSLSIVLENHCSSLFEKVLKDTQHPLRELFLHRTPTLRNLCTLRPPRTRTKRFKDSFIRFCFT